VKREEEEERERIVAKEKWLREREDKKRTLQVRFREKAQEHSSSCFGSSLVRMR